MHLGELVQRARLIKSAGVGGGRICLFSLSMGISGRHLLTYPFSSFLFSTIICFGSGWHFIVPFHFPVLRYITDIDDPNYCNEPL